MLQIWFITIATDRIHRQCTRLRCFITTMLGVVFDRHCAKWFIAIPVLDTWFVAVVADRDGSLPLCQTEMVHIVSDRDGSLPLCQTEMVHIVSDRDGSLPLCQTKMVHNVPDSGGLSTLCQTEMVRRHCGRQRWLADIGGRQKWQTEVVHHHCARQRWFIPVVQDRDGSSPATRVPCHRTSRPAGPRGTDDTD